MWLGPMSVSAAAEEKAAFPVATPESQGVSAAAVRRMAVRFRYSDAASDTAAAVVELKEPDKEGRWQLVFTNAVAVSFKKDSGGKVLAPVLHQSGMSFELPRDKPVDAERPKK